MYEEPLSPSPNTAGTLLRRLGGRDRAHPPREVCPGPARKATGSQVIRPDRLNPQSQSLSRSYGSNLPISLTYILLSTRGCSPRRPDADIGTNRRERPKRYPPAGFSRASRERPRTARKRAALRDRLFTALSSKTLSLRDGIPGSRSLKQKRKLFPGFSTASPVCVALPRPNETGVSDRT